MTRIWFTSKADGEYWVNRSDGCLGHVGRDAQNCWEGFDRAGQNVGGRFLRRWEASEAVEDEHKLRERAELEQK